MRSTNRRRTIRFAVGDIQDLSAISPTGHGVLITDNNVREKRWD